MMFRPRFLPSLRDGKRYFALFRWYRCAQVPAAVWQPFGLQPLRVVGAQRLSCAQPGLFLWSAIDTLVL